MRDATPRTTAGHGGTERGRPLIVSLREAAASPVDLVGGKAQELGRLLVGGHNVPDGFVITTEVADIADVRRALADLLAALGNPRMAYRSSAVAEDLAHASYAGQYTTVLDVEGPEAGLEALHTCLQSTRSDAVSGYRAAQGDVDERIAVIVQRMVDATAAGVAFSANPVTGADEVVLEAVAGLGDALMDGAVSPERWVASAGGSPSRTEALDQPVLTQGQAHAVAAECRTVATARGVPVDIEWAFDGDELLLLQARPITALPREPEVDIPKGQTWVRSDAYFAHPVTPLGYSAWLPRHTRAFAEVTSYYGLPFDGIDHRHWYGRVYDRVLPVGGIKKDHPLPPKFVLKAAMRLAPPMRKRLAIAALAASEDRPMAAIDAWENGGRETLRARTRDLVGVDRAALDDAALADHLDEALAHVLDAGISHFMLAFSGMFVLAGQLGLLMEELLDWAPERLLDLVEGHGGASTVEGEALDRLVEAIQATPDRRDDLISIFVDQWGHKVTTNDLLEPTWAEDRAPLERILDVRLAVRSGDVGARRSGDDLRASAAKAEAEALGLIHDPDDRARFVRALGRARRGRPYGDETERDVNEAMAIIRYIAVEAAKRLVARHRLRSVGDVFFLEVEELASTLRGSVVPADDIDRRKAEHRWALANPTPSTIGKPPSGAPSPDVFPKAAQPIAGACMFSLALFEAMGPALTEVRERGEGTLSGVAASPGVVTGTARLIESPAQFDQVHHGDILVCHHTMAAWSPIFPIVAGVVTEHGGPLSHPGTLAREYGIPAVLSVKDARAAIPDGATITVDGSRGLVTIV